VRVNPSDEQPIYQLLGAGKLDAIVAGFYRRVAADPILRPLYPEQDLGPAEQRLRSFLVYRFGGPPDYLRDRGHPRLRMRHAPFAVDRAARDRWMELMMAAVDEAGVETQHRDYLERFLGDIATFLINRP
jgi:hemoglobin